MDKDLYIDIYMKRDGEMGRGIMKGKIVFRVPDAFPCKLSWIFLKNFHHAEKKANV